MQRPASREVLVKARTGSWPVALNRGRDGDGGRANRRRSLSLDGAPDERNLFFAGDIDRDIRKAALDLEPLIPDLAREPMGVIVERLVQHPDDDQAPVAA